MNYHQTSSVSDNNDVAMALTAQSPATPQAGISGHFLRACIVFALRENQGRLKHLIPFDTAIGDLALTLKENPWATNGYTYIKVKDDSVLRGKGSRNLWQVIGAALASLVLGTIRFAAGLLQPYFGVLVQMAFDLVSSGRHKAKEANHEITTEYFKWWSFVRWQRIPGAVAQEFETAFLPPMPSSGATFTASLSESVQYELEGHAQTGIVRFIGGINNLSVQPTGDISARVSFRTDWQ